MNAALGASQTAGSRFDIIAAVVSKEWAEVVRNKMLLSTIAILPIVFLAMAVGTLAGVQTGPVDPQDVANFVERSEQFAGIAPADVLQIIMLNQFLLFFLMMPSIIPMTMASYSIIGEKQSRTLEPLLATPASTGEILVGKVISAVVPAVGATWACYGLFLAISYFIVSPVVWLAAANATWLTAMLVIGPLLAVFSVFIGVVVSSRVNDTRVAQQFGGLLVLPVVAFGIAQTAGVIFLSQAGFIAAAAVLAAADVAAYYVAVGLFQRDQILTRWR